MIKGPELRGSRVVPLMAVTAVATIAIHKSTEHANTKEAEPSLASTPQELVPQAYELNEAALVSRAVVTHHGHRRHHLTHLKPRHLTPAQWAARQVTPAEFAAWSKVNHCEEHGRWHVRGSEYSGGLGISNYNWNFYRKKYFPRFPHSAADATRKEQIVLAMRIQPNPPDQHGCDPNGW